MQRNNDDQMMHPVFYLSRKTSEAEEKYDSYTLEALAVVKAVDTFRPCIMDKKFKIITDCEAFRRTMDKRTLVPRVAR